MSAPRTVTAGVQAALVERFGCFGGNITAVGNMSCCAVTGQGAGVAAALSIRTDRAMDDVDIDAVQAELVRQDVRIS
jgi:hypothetical protein